MLRLVLVDDHRLFREGLRALLGDQPDLRVVGEAADAEGTYPLVAAARPEVLLLDVGLPGPGGISVTRELKRRGADARILMLSAHADGDLVAQALAAGALGYSLKTQPIGDVVDAIRSVGRGERYLSAALARCAQAAEPSSSVRAPGPLFALSLREQEIFGLLVHGFGNDAIGAHLCISVKTVETHRAHILKKLGVHSLVELVRLAARHQLLRE
jgi:two-component system invasion response regulator UvrY